MPDSKFKLQVAISCIMLCPIIVHADSHSTTAKDAMNRNAASLFKVHVDQRRIEQNMIVENDFLRPHFASDQKQDETTIKQYDAALFYPLEHKGLDIGLGINLRMIEGVLWNEDNGRYQSRNFSEAIPMFYASALMNLPFKGLSAGFEGRHSESLSNRSFDYRARLHYEWNNGLGFDGGWQYQQYTDERLNVLPDSHESNTLFLDMRLKF